ncbi:MAG: hypothetical protein EA398_14030 [Deltaproteobacteria bacterium]|nr:MAG: hypothetical protein EA398_14030 [Deltaproteobacteria bacterium]
MAPQHAPRHTLSPSARDRARRVADLLDSDHGFRDRAAPFARHRLDAETDGPQLHLEDVTGIPFLSGIPAVEEYQHRARVRAGDGDFFAAGTPATPGYEAYCRRIGLGAPTLIPVRNPDDPMAVARACATGDALDQLATAAREHGRLTIHPYMGIEDVWHLAKTISDASDGAEVRVLAPPPPITWLANDKDLLVRAVEAAAGEHWNVRTERARTASDLADLLGQLAGQAPRVGLKRTRCASAMGNEVHTSSHLTTLSPSERRTMVERFLERTEWCGSEEVLVVVWEDTDLSPSTQLWIPPAESGLPPRLDGVYDQILTGEERVFVGSRPSRLPAPVQDALAETSLAVAAVFQELGYVGRCSFDFIVVGDPDGDWRAHFTECNGRWGGTSTPMRLVDRLVPGPRPNYRSQGFSHPALHGRSFAEVLDAVGDEVLDPTRGTGRFIFYNTGPLRPKGKLDVIAVGDDADDAIESLLPALIERHLR